jgi:hypothetical protein
MIRTPVKSSSLKSVGYDPATKALEIEFASGQVYRYADVPAESFADLMSAASIGRQMGAFKASGFAFEKVEPEQPPAEHSGE